MSSNNHNGDGKGKKSDKGKKPDSGKKRARDDDSDSNESLITKKHKKVPRPVMKWNSANDRKLLLHGLSKEIRPKEHHKIADTFSQQPTDKSIAERLQKLRKFGLDLHNKFKKSTTNDSEDTTLSEAQEIDWTIAADRELLLFGLGSQLNLRHFTQMADHLARNFRDEFTTQPNAESINLRYNELREEQLTEINRVGLDRPDRSIHQMPELRTRSRPTAVRRQDPAYHNPRPTGPSMGDYMDAQTTYGSSLAQSAMTPRAPTAMPPRAPRIPRTDPTVVPTRWLTDDLLTDAGRRAVRTWEGFNQQERDAVTGMMALPGASLAAALSAPPQGVRRPRSPTGADPAGDGAESEEAPPRQRRRTAHHQPGFYGRNAGVSQPDSEDEFNDKNSGYDQGGDDEFGGER